ncbi:protein-glutamine gamma-glutamyltransferase [Oceanobacillus damuensis]|uniref:protein-glutamine gamma-glutamyltransferase n=1 Tax=Oceanobacillus damuensis TaxID=937928 RepID=UPI00082E5B3E
MIQVAGIEFQQTDLWPTGSIENIIIQRMAEHPIVYSYSSIEELRFEVKLRNNIIASARAMNAGDARFETFDTSRSNPRYWRVTSAGGFQLRHDVLPSDAIRDIFENSSLYGFECAMAKVMIYYHAVLNTMDDDNLFNQLFQNIYLYSWNFDPDLGIQTIYTTHVIPGDVVYFNNPDVNPETSWWRGENAVDLGDGTYFGHGLGIRSADEMIQALNEMRRSGSTRSAYMLEQVTRPSFKNLANISLSSRRSKVLPVVIHHGKCSISCDEYLFYLNAFYSNYT